MVVCATVHYTNDAGQSVSWESDSMISTGYEPASGMDLWTGCQLYKDEAALLLHPFSDPVCLCSEDQGGVPTPPMKRVRVERNVSKASQRSLGSFFYQQESHPAHITPATDSLGNGHVSPRGEDEQPRSLRNRSDLMPTLGSLLTKGSNTEASVRTQEGQGTT